VVSASRFIVWKLACYERAFPAAFPPAAPASRRPLCGERVLDELRLRYEREHNRAQRPVLRRVFEGDTPPGAPMCLAVCGLRAIAAPVPQKPAHARGGGGGDGDAGAAGGSNDAAAAPPANAGGPLSFELELTDGAENAEWAHGRQNASVRHC
jgi:hypothetical protein